MKYFERVIHSYVHNGRIGVLVELGMQSDFTARLEQISSFLKDAAIHIAAAAPTDIEDLMSQEFVKDTSKTIGELLSELSSEVREEIAITRFIRWDVENVPDEREGPPNDPSTAMRLRAVK